MQRLLPFYKRFEVLQTFSETLAIHALDNERISDLAEHADEILARTSAN